MREIFDSSELRRGCVNGIPDVDWGIKMRLVSERYPEWTEKREKLTSEREEEYSRVRLEK